MKLGQPTSIEIPATCFTLTHTQKLLLFIITIKVKTKDNIMECKGLLKDKAENISRQFFGQL